MWHHWDFVNAISCLQKNNLKMLKYKAKAKVYVYSPGIHVGSEDLPPGIGTHSFTVPSPRGECSTFSAAKVIHTVPIFVPPGTFY